MSTDFQPGLSTGLASQLVVIYRSNNTAQPFNLTLNGGLGGFQSWNDAVYGQYWVGPVTEQGTSGCYQWTRPTGITDPVSWEIRQVIGETPSTDTVVGQGSDPVTHVIVDSYNTGASPADLILNPSSNRIAVDATGAVNAIGGGGGDAQAVRDAMAKALTGGTTVEPGSVDAKLGALTPGTPNNVNVRVGQTRVVRTR